MMMYCAGCILMLGVGHNVIYLYIYTCSFVVRMCLINSGDVDVDILSAHLRPTLMILNIDDAAGALGRKIKSNV